MNSKKIFLTAFGFFIAMHLTVAPGFSQIKKHEIIFHHGIITSISWDRKSIVVYNKTFLIPSGTRIVNEKEGILSIEDLKPELYVVIEGIQSPNGFLVKKIIVKKPAEV